MKKKKKAQERNSAPSPKPTTWYFNFLRLVFELFDIHLSLINLQEETWTHSKWGKASSLTTY